MGCCRPPHCDGEKDELGRPEPTLLVDGDCPACGFTWSHHVDDETCHKCGGDAVPIELDRGEWRIQEWRSVPGSLSLRLSRGNFRESVPAAEVFGYLGHRAAELLRMYDSCYVETVAGFGGSVELCVSLREREALYRLLGIDVEPGDNYLRELICTAFAAINRARSEGKMKGSEEKRKADEKAAKAGR